MARAIASPLDAGPGAARQPDDPAEPDVSGATAHEFLTTDEAGSFLRLSPRTLEKQRVLGGGPRFRKFGARVVYAVEDLRHWANSRSYEMTSDPGYTQRSTVR